MNEDHLTMQRTTIYDRPPVGGPKTSKYWRDFGLRDLIANISGRQHVIVDRKTALETAITPLRAY